MTPPPSRAGDSEPRPSSVKLADALTEAGLTDLAPRARAGEWHTYDGPEYRPRERLLAIIQARADRAYSFAARAKITELRQRIRDGEYDAPLSESVKRKPKPSLRDRAAKSGLILP